MAMIMMSYFLGQCIIITSLLYCRNGHLNVASYLITSCGASVLATGYNGETPLHTAWYTCYNI